MSEAVIPEGGFQTFGQFFARDLAPGTRVIDQTPRAFVSPCDGVVQAVGSFRASTPPELFIKGHSYAVQELMVHQGWWSTTASGGFIVIYLSPADYHRVHSPVDGEVHRLWRLPGTCMPVNKLGQILAPWAIVRNERVVYDLTTGDGHAAVVMVGALAVRAISVSLKGIQSGAESGSGPIPVNRAQEIGVFNLGSTVVLLWQGEAQVDVKTGERVRFGQRVAQR